MDLLVSLREMVFLAAAIALGVNVWRASRLLQLVFRGEALLQADLAVRRRETDGLFANQARRVEALAEPSGRPGAADSRRRNFGARPADVRRRNAASRQSSPAREQFGRALKRFVNLYRLVRAQDQDHKGALAFMLALDADGTPSEIAAVNDALSNSEPEADLELHQCGARLIEALAAVQSAQGKVSVNAARRAAATARMFSFNG